MVTENDDSDDDSEDTPGGAPQTKSAEDANRKNAEDDLGNAHEITFE